jgi:hypothetical protein
MWMLVYFMNVDTRPKEAVEKKSKVNVVCGQWISCPCTVSHPCFKQGFTSEEGESRKGKGRIAVTQYAGKLKGFIASAFQKQLLPKQKLRCM